MTPIITLPGIGGSGPTHWQSLWEQDHPSIRRFRPSSWDEPRLDDWLGALDAAVAKSASPPILVAHSLACLLVAHWAARGGQRRVAGAFLVAVPDPAGPAFPPIAGTFHSPPAGRLVMPSLVIASRDDPYGSLVHATTCARGWGSGLIDAGPRGHLNADSGLGRWPEGWGWLVAFAAGCGKALVGS